MNKLHLSLGSLAVASALFLTGCVYDDLSYAPESNTYIYDPVPLGYYDPVPIGGGWGPPPYRNDHHHKHHPAPRPAPPPPVVAHPQTRGYGPSPAPRPDTHHHHSGKPQPQPVGKPGKPNVKPVPQSVGKPGNTQPQQPKVAPGKKQQPMKFMPMKKGAKYLN